MWKGILVGILVLVLLAFGIWGWRYFTAPIRGEVQKQETVNSGDYRIYSYDHFFNLHASIQAYEDQIRNQRQLLETLEDPQEQARYRQNINALMNQRAKAVRQYNADVQKEGTRGQFKADSLPESISIDF